LRLAVLPVPRPGGFPSPADDYLERELDLNDPDCGNSGARGSVLKSSPFHLKRSVLRKNAVAAYSSNYTLYGDLSRRMMQVLSNFTPEVEIYSIDEAFLNLAGFEDRDLIAYCRVMREEVRRATGIPVSIGIGVTKTLAKIANRIAKKNPTQAESSACSTAPTWMTVSPISRRVTSGAWVLAGRRGCRSRRSQRRSISSGQTRSRFVQKSPSWASALYGS
jgi:DNA polymerase V